MAVLVLASFRLPWHAWQQAGLLQNLGGCEGYYKHLECPTGRVPLAFLGVVGSGMSYKIMSKKTHIVLSIFSDCMCDKQPPSFILKIKPPVMLSIILKYIVSQFLPSGLSLLFHQK